MVEVFVSRVKARFAVNGIIFCWVTMALCQNQDFSIFFNADGEITEAAQMDMAHSNELLPSASRTRQIENHLMAIRKQYPIVEDINFSGSWLPGDLLVYNFKKPVGECIELIEASEYGPLTSSKDIGSVQQFIFQKPFNSKKLALIISKICEASAEPNGRVGDGDDILIDTLDETISKYTFSKGSGDCPSGCTKKQFWQFSVSAKGVTLEKEWVHGDSGVAGVGFGAF